MEKFFEKNDLPSGEKVNLYTWTARAMAIAVIVLFITLFITGNTFDAIVGALFALLIIAWVGPYAQYAIAWNFLKDKVKK
jgi:cytochrome b subunit of formate dehydrogenase